MEPFDFARLYLLPPGGSLMDANTPNGAAPTAGPGRCALDLERYTSQLIGEVRFERRALIVRPLVRELLERIEARAITYADTADALHVIKAALEART